MSQWRPFSFNPSQNPGHYYLGCDMNYIMAATFPRLCCELYKSEEDKQADKDLHTCFSLILTMAVIQLAV